MSENISEQTAPAYKKSFFGDYFRYKLRTGRGSIILFAILNFLTTAGYSAAAYFFEKYWFLPRTKYSDVFGDLGADILFLLLTYAVVFAVIVELVTLCVLPAVNFRFFNKRSHMDTLGGLPLTTAQRFFGDMLSGAAMFGISFVPCAVTAAFFAAITDAGPAREMLQLNDYYTGFPWRDESTLKIFAVIILTELLCYIAAYAISCFVASCCGKISSSILFSLVTNAALALTVVSTAMYIYENAVGYDRVYSYQTPFSAIAPVGTLIQTLTAINDHTGGYVVLTPLVMIILLTTALFTYGAYIAAMKRKAERVDREFVFDALYYVFPAVITIAAGMVGVSTHTMDISTSSLTVPMTLIALVSTIVLSVILIRYFRKKGKNYAIIGVLPTIITALLTEFTVKVYRIEIWGILVPLILIALAACLVLSYLRKRSAKEIWKGAALFISSLFACFLTGVIIQGTNGFGISYYLPSAAEIESVELSGGMVTNKIRPAQGERTLTVKTESGIETVISEHKKLIDDLDNYVSGSRHVNTQEVICLTYHYKNGLNSYRAYCYNGRETEASDRSDYRFVNAVSEIPELYDMTLFGILQNPDMPCTGITYHDGGHNVGGAPDLGEYLVVKASARDRFIECYLKDLSDNGSIQTGDWFARIDYSYLGKAGEHKNYMLYLYTEYTNVIGFLSDPENLESGAETTIDESKTYNVHFSVDENFSIYFTITHPELAREFFSYAEEAVDIDDTHSVDASVYDEDYSHRYTIREENRQAALKALIKAIRAHQAIGG